MRERNIGKPHFGHRRWPTGGDVWIKIKVAALVYCMSGNGVGQSANVFKMVNAVN